MRLAHRDLVEGGTPATLYLVVPPSDISRTKPLIRLILNQIGRRLTEELEANRRRHRLLLMLDEFPALGQLDFLESALAFMAGYGLKSFLIAQSLNQIEKAYGQNNSILDNCHVRVSFTTNDERTAKRVSDALGTATEMRTMKNYAGHRRARRRETLTKAALEQHDSTLRTAFRRSRCGLVMRLRTGPRIRDARPKKAMAAFIQFSSNALSKWLSDPPSQLGRAQPVGIPYPVGVLIARWPALTGFWH
jgi:hypothetical protein